ncbi:MAG: glucokinase [Pseudomonadota bacterium]
MQVVAVDIGGTHARFALAEVGDGRVRTLGEPTTLKTAEHASFQSAWAAFAASQPDPLPRAAAIAIAAPVKGDVLQLTNNPWVIRPALIPEQLGVDAHVLVNDFEAVGHAVAQVDDDALIHVAGPMGPLPAGGMTTIVGPGTGLGVAMLYREGPRYHVIPCEGGHIEFAPLDAVEDAVLADLRAKHRRVSAERIVSGPGLAPIYNALARIEGREPTSLDDKALWTAAFDGSDSLAATALDRFCLSLGSIAGDLALAQGANSVVIAGGLGLRLADRLPTSGFAERFTAKGRFQSMMAGVPVRLITHPQPGLLGAAAAFAREFSA